MTRLLPSIILLTHDVAVDAGFGIAAEIRKTFAIVDGIGTRTDTQTQHDPDEKTRQAATNQPLEYFHAYSSASEAGIFFSLATFVKDASVFVFKK